MDFSTGYRKVINSNSATAGKLLEAKSKKRPLKIKYVNKKGLKTSRLIMPKELYKNNYGKIYVEAYCYRVKEERVFLLDKLIIDSSDISIEPVAIKEDKKTQKEIAHEHSSGRPICVFPGCRNLAEIRHKKHNKIKYLYIKRN